MSCMLMFIWPGFSQPWWLLTLLVIPLWLAVLRYRKTESYPTIKSPNLKTVMLATGTRTRIWPAIAKYTLYATMALLALALARPHWSILNPEQHTEGIDIVITMDISLSMLARDFEPNRLDAAKDVAARFISERETDRIGLVLFAGQSFTLCPLTSDKAALITLLQQAHAGFIEDGNTAIGDGIATSINRLRESNAKSKVIILLTDGENNAGNIDPLQAAEIAAMFGIRLYTIGVGSRGVAIGPVQIIGGNLIFGPVEVDIDEPTLIRAAEMTGGQYYRAIDENALYQIYQEIDKLEKSRLERTTHHARNELFPFLLIPAVVLMMISWLIHYLFVKPIP